jgi:hypothetical protein
MANAQPPVWSSDVPISIPQAPADQVLIPMFGFGFTRFGLVHDLTEVEQEYLRTPSYSPERPGDVVYEDGDVD